MEDVLIREAETGDVKGVLAIYRAAGLEPDEGFTIEEAAAHLERFRRYPSYRLFVAVLGGEVAGTYSLLIMDKLAKRGVRAGVAEDVGVMPGLQGKGIGRTMMVHAMKECRAAGCYKLALSSNLRRTAAHDFYAAMGFKRHGVSFVVALD